MKMKINFKKQEKKEWKQIINNIKKNSKVRKKLKFQMRTIL